MSEFETFEVSISSFDKRQDFLLSSLQNVGKDETFQSLFDRLIEPFSKQLSLSDGLSNKNNLNNCQQLSPSSNSSISSSSSSTSSSKNHLFANDNKIEKLDIKSIQCTCYSCSNLSISSGSGCNVSLSFNIHLTARRHNFLRISYQIDIPLNVNTNKINKNDKNIKTIKKLKSEPIRQKKRKYSKFHELANHLNASRSAMRGSKRKSRKYLYKEFKTRESLLTILFVVPEFRSLYFIFLAGFLLFFSSILIDDYLHEGEVFHSLSLVEWNFQNFNLILTTWSYTIIYCNTIVVLFYIWRHNMFIFSILSKINRQWNDYIYCFCYILYQIPLFIYPAIWSQEFNVAGSLIIACEQTRMILKTHAFFVETFKTKRYYDKLNANKNNNNNNNHNNNNHGGDDDEKLNESSNKLRVSLPYYSQSQSQSQSQPDNSDINIIPWLVDIDMNFADQIMSFIFFLFIPILIYRTSYPRTKSISWNRVFQHLRDVILSFSAVWVIFCRFCIPFYRLSPSSPGNLSVLISEFISGSIPGMMLLLLGFFGFLHSWLNLFAELLRFGDRQFYQDWWNARSFAQYYRKWNCVVHDWIYNYMYLPVLEEGYSKTFAMFLVFGTSSLIHEYILVMGCKFFYPVLLFMFGGLGVFFVPFTRLWNNARGWNLFLWSMLLIGQGILLVLYSREYYARNDKTVLKYIDQNSWIPYSIQLFQKRDEILN